MSVQRTIVTKHKLSCFACDKRGFTLTEMLVTLLIMVLASTLLATGVPVAIDTYTKTVNSANAQMALSTTITAFRGDCGKATRVMEMSGVVYFLSEDGIWATIRNPNGSESYHGVVIEYFNSDASGNPMPSDPLGVFPLVPDSAIHGVRDALWIRIQDVDGSTSKISFDSVNRLIAVPKLSVYSLAADGTKKEYAAIDQYAILLRFI